MERASRSVGIGNGERDGRFGGHAGFGVVHPVWQRADNARFVVRGPHPQAQAAGYGSVHIVGCGNAHAELIGRNRARSQITAVGLGVHVPGHRRVAKVGQVGVHGGLITR